MSDLERELEAIDLDERCEVDGCRNRWSFCDVGEGGLYLCDEHSKREAVMSEDLMPTPTMWAQCSECGTAYVMRRMLSCSKGYVWIWSIDCKHKKAAPVLADADGPLEHVEGRT